MSLEDLYKAKGELVTQIEIAQAKLQQVNKQIIDSINQQLGDIKKEKGIEIKDDSFKHE